MPSRLDLLLQLHHELPNDDFTLFALAKEYETLGQPDVAIDYYANLMEKHPDYVGVYYHFGKILEHQNRLDEALIIYEKGISVAQKVGDTHALSELRGVKMNLEIEMD
jgi:tetratricopeptide (TPR) repeat protein